jgi:hypothetical protein
MRISKRVHLIYWGFNTFRFKKSLYLNPSVKIFTSYDFGCFELRVFFKQKKKYRYPTSAPFLAQVKRRLERRKKLKLSLPEQDEVMKEFQKFKYKTKEEILKAFDVKKK